MHRRSFRSLIVAVGCTAMTSACSEAGGESREMDQPVSASTDTCAAGEPYCYEAPVHLPPPINTPYFEGKPALSTDGLELYFVSDRPGALGGDGDQDIYVSRRASVGGDWGEPERLPPPISSPSFDITPTISQDGLTLYFASNRPGPFSPPLPDLFVSRRASVNDPWGEAVNLGPGVNTVAFEGSISISPDGRQLYYAGNFGPPDFVFHIFKSTRRTTDEPFGQGMMLGSPINTSGQSYGPQLVSNQDVMFFTAGADNPFAPGHLLNLYVSERQGDAETWGPPIYLDTINCTTCNSELPAIRADGDEICWIGDRGDSYGNADIYCATRD